MSSANKLSAALILCLAACAGLAIADSPVAQFDAQLAAPADPSAYYAKLAEAKNAQAAGKFADAERLYQELTQDYALERETWVALATAARQQGKHAAAIDAYARSIALIGPVPGSSRYWTAVSQAALGDSEAALDTLEAMVFQDAELDRPGLYADPNFASLQKLPRMRTLTGHEDLSKLDRISGWRADLAHLCAEIKRLSPTYRDRPLPETTERMRRELHEQIPKLSDEQVYARLAQLLGSLKQGHTMLWGAGPGGPEQDARLAFSWLPVLLYAFPEGLFVVSADAANSELIGMRVLSIDREPIASVFQKVASATSYGSDMEALWTMPIRIADVQLLQGLGIVKDPGSIELRLRGLDGKLLERKLVAGAMNPRAKLPKPPKVSAPKFLVKQSEAHWHEVWKARKTVYVQLNQMAPDPDETLPQFGIRLREVLRTSKAQSLVVDLRHNNGGDTFSYAELLRTLVGFSIEPGKSIYVLTGRNVYSAAANFATDLERLASPITVGEPTSMTGNQDGDEGAVRLPWSKVRATVSGVRWQLSHPWDKRRSIAPKVPVQLTAAAYFAGQDPVLETVEKLIDASLK